MAHDLKPIVEQFQLPGHFLDGAPYGSGHINDTYAVTVAASPQPVRYILQRINHDIFKDPLLVMHNIDRVTRHLRNKLEAAGAEDIDRRTLTLIPTRDDSICHVDDAGQYWRMYIFIEGCRTYDEIEATEQAHAAAQAFGRFQAQLFDLPGEPLTETIPGFHDTRARYDALVEAITADSHNRAALAKTDIDFACDREAMVDKLLALQKAGRLPLMTTHNDTKINNVMLDNNTGEGLCVIDLDTVMPGLSLYDFGDMARSTMCPCPEDHPDSAGIVARLDRFQAIANGYLQTAGPMLNQDEIDHMAFSARLITFEIGLRFLADFLQGDTYFKTHCEGQNLDRARVQFSMVRSMEDQMDAMEQAVQDAPRSS